MTDIGSILAVRGHFDVSDRMDSRSQKGEDQRILI